MVEFLSDSKQPPTTTITMGREAKALLVSSANEKATCFLVLISSSDSTDGKRETFPQTDQSLTKYATKQINGWTSKTLDLRMYKQMDNLSVNNHRSKVLLQSACDPEL